MTRPVEIRAARAEDVDAVVALVESAYRGDSSRVGWTTEADLLDGQRTDAEEVRSALPSLLLAVEGDDLLGCCVLAEKDGAGYFGMFAVRPALQGGGVGSALLTAAEDRARSHGLPAVEMTVLSTRSELLAYYRRRGYADTGQTRPFPYGDERFGRPRVADLEFLVLRKPL